MFRGILCNRIYKYSPLLGITRPKMSSQLNWFTSSPQTIHFMSGRTFGFRAPAPSSEQGCNIPFAFSDRWTSFMGGYQPLCPCPSSPSRSLSARFGAFRPSCPVAPRTSEKDRFLGLCLRFLMTNCEIEIEIGNKPMKNLKKILSWNFFQHVRTSKKPYV